MAKRKKAGRTPEHALLVELINEASRQLEAEKPDLDAVEGVLAKRPEQSLASPLVPLGQMYKTAPALPSGPEIRSLPRLSDAAGGLFGLWVLAGEPGLGKSTLAIQLACSGGQHMPVLLYDYENGPELIAARAHQALGSSFARAAERWYVRESMSTLDDDIAFLGGGKVMVIVDSFQSLPAAVDHSTESLAKWMRRFERLARAGHMVLLISEKNRDHYGEAHLAGFKGTGALEYKAWFGVQLVGDPEDEDAPIEVHVVKNRNRKRRGYICDLVRDRERTFWFKEAEPNRGEEVN